MKMTTTKYEAISDYKNYNEIHWHLLLMTKSGVKMLGWEEQNQIRPGCVFL